MQPFHITKHYHHDKLYIFFSSLWSQNFTRFLLISYRQHVLKSRVQTFSYRSNRQQMYHLSIRSRSGSPCPEVMALWMQCPLLPAGRMGIRSISNTPVPFTPVRGQRTKSRRGFSLTIGALLFVFTCTRSQKCLNVSRWKQCCIACNNWCHQTA